LSALGDIDVREDLARVRVPTLVVHSRGDTFVPIKDGIEPPRVLPGRGSSRRERQSPAGDGERVARFDRELDTSLRAPA
jgi:pimeloyl-ACP methyl ester carboxylesterase